MKNGSLTSAHIRTARALLRWSAADFARESALGANTVRRAEVAEEVTSLTVASELAVRRTLENADVEFIDENGGGLGVRLRSVQKPNGETIVSPKRSAYGPIESTIVPFKRLFPNFRIEHGR
jgi:hypothetical protein